MTNAALTAIEQAFLGPAINDLTALEQPGVTWASVAQAAGGISLQEILVLPGVESALINLVASSIKAKLTAVVTPASPVATPATPTSAA